MKYAIAVIVLLTSVPVFAQRGTAPARSCRIAWSGMPVGSHTFTIKTASGKYTTWIGGGFRARCEGTNMIVTSDSMEYSEDARVLTLFGNARYREDSTSIDADIIRYTETDERIVADGNVKARMRTGSTLTAPLVHYQRPRPRVRPFAVVDAFGRGHLVMKDSVKMTDSAATKVDADHLHVERDSLYKADGRVVITRPDIVATSDSADSNTGKGSARLSGGSPRIVGQGGRRFSVAGRVIDIFGQRRQVDSLHALGRAVAVSDSMTLTADTLHLRTTGTLIDRVLAWGPGRAHALSPDRDISATRIEIVMPKQRLNEVIAIGRARAETRADSLVRSTERDWIEGDSLNARFEVLAAADTSRQPPLREILARGNARSFYQVPSRDKSDSLPTLNYVIGKRINVAFSAGDVHEVRVTGEVRGINLNPLSALARDSTAKARTPARGGGQ